MDSRLRGNDKSNLIQSLTAIIESKPRKSSRVDGDFVDIRSSEKETAGIAVSF